jgi:hypothetical protein
LPFLEKGITFVHDSKTWGFFRISLAANAEASCAASLLAEGGVEFKPGCDRKTQQVKGTRATRDPNQMQRPKLNVTKVEVKADADIGRSIGMDQAAMIESRLRDEPAPGFAFAFNDTPTYTMQQGTNVAWQSFFAP